MVDELVRTRYVYLELHNGGPAGRYERGLNVFGVVGPSLRIDAIENLPNDMEAGHEVRSAIPDEQTDTVSDFGFQGLSSQQRSFSAVEYDIGRMLIDRLFHVEGLMTFFIVRSLRIEIALHHIVFMFYGSQSARRLDQNESVHAVGDMLANWCRRAVIDVEPGIERLERELRAAAWCSVAAGSSTAWTGHRMEVDVMREPAVGMVHEV